MTKDLHPGLGSGALREALADVIQFFDSNYESSEEWCSGPSAKYFAGLLVKLRALSLSNPIELASEIDPHSPNSQAIIEKWLIAYQAGEAKAGDCKSILDTLRAQASTGIREALDVGKLAVRLAFYIREISPVGSIGRVELASYIRKEIESALTPSRQGAAKRVEG